MPRGFVPNLRGLDEILASDAVEDAQRAAAAGIVAEAKRIAPVADGTDRKGLRVVVDHGRVYASGTAPHSHLVEWGSGPRPGGGVMPAQRVLARALDAAVSDASR